MIKILKSAKVYAPEYLGIKDIMISGDRIVKVSDNIEISSQDVEIEYIDCKGMTVVPGFIDQHVHLIGGGGEAGYHSRTPEININSLIEAGVTTVIGLLGTDGVARSVESLLAKAHGLEFEGISTYILTGAYDYPSPTITDSVKKDIMFIEKVIGVKIALSDHRSSHVTKDELLRLASQARVGGMLSGKAGIIAVHMGDEKAGLKLIKEISRETDIPINQFIPTHIGRNRQLLEESIEYAKMGGLIDITAGMQLKIDGQVYNTAKAIINFIKCGVPIENITISSDGNGSFSEYDENGRITKIGVSPVDTVHKAIKTLVFEENLSMELALKLATENVAKNLMLYPAKGCIKEESHADILIMDRNMDIKTVIAKGRILS